MSSDLKYAKVYISSLKGMEESEVLSKWLNHARGYIQSLLAETLELRFIPMLVFAADDSIEYGMKVEEILYELFPEDDTKDTTNNQG